MAYFFGFFGISFLDTNAMERSPSSFGLSHLDGHLYASSNQRQQGAEFAGAAGKGGEIQYWQWERALYPSAQAGHTAVAGFTFFGAEGRLVMSNLVSKRGRGLLSFCAGQRR